MHVIIANLHNLTLCNHILVNDEYLGTFLNDSFLRAKMRSLRNVPRYSLRNVPKPHYPLTAPAVRPLINCLDIHRNRMISGIDASRMPASIPV